MDFELLFGSRCLEDRPDLEGLIRVGCTSYVDEIGLVPGTAARCGGRLLGCHGLSCNVDTQNSRTAQSDRQTLALTGFQIVPGTHGHGAVLCNNDLDISAADYSFDNVLKLMLSNTQRQLSRMLVIAVRQIRLCCSERLRQFTRIDFFQTPRRGFHG